METKTELPLEYQIWALSLQQEGAIKYFLDHLPISVVQHGGAGHAQFYRALLNFHIKTGSNPVDKVAFKSWLESETMIHEALGGSEGVEEYLTVALDAELSTPETVTRTLQYRHNKHRQETLSHDLNELIVQPDRDEETVEKISEIISEIKELNRGQADPFSTVSDGTDIADRASAMWELPNFLASPFPSLNKAMGYTEDAGFCKGAVHAVLAASGKGKSTFAKCLMNHWVENNYTVLYVNYEEAKDHWEKVLFTQITKQNVYKSERLTHTEKKHYTKIFEDKMRQWNGNFLVEHDPETAYFEDIEAQVRARAAVTDIDVIIFDTIQSMFLKGNGKNLPRWGQYEIMMVKLEKLAKDLGAVVIITAQENSNRLKEKREVVQQSDIGGSLSIAQKSSITIFITDAKAETGDDAQDENIMQLQIPKNRITGVAFMMDPPLVRYNDEIKSYEPYELVSNSPYDSNVVLSDILNDNGEFI